MLLAPLLIASLTLSRHVQDGPKLSISGDVAHRREFTNAELRQTFASEIRDVSFALKGEPGHAHAIPLMALVGASAPKVDQKRKHAALAAVVVSAADGYATVFSLGELTPEIGKHDVWVALDWNEKPLPESDSPARLIVPGDEKPSRWVHGVRSIKVVNLTPKGLPIPKP